MSRKRSTRSGGSGRGSRSYHVGRSGFSGEGQRPHAQRKALQLCKQVERTLTYVLSGETGDDVLRNLLVDSVVPAPDESHLIVSVRPLPGSEAIDTADVLTRLYQHRPMLREEIAASIHRRFVPEISFKVALGQPAPWANQLPGAGPRSKD